MTWQIKGAFFACAVALTLSACASTGPVRSTRTASTREDFPGYVHVASRGEEFFCKQEIPLGTYFQHTVCFTRIQLIARRDWNAAAGIP
jgi:hypothetical protein